MACGAPRLRPLCRSRRRSVSTKFGLSGVPTSPLVLVGRLRTRSAAMASGPPSTIPAPARRRMPTELDVGELQAKLERLSPFDQGPEFPPGDLGTSSKTAQGPSLSATPQASAGPPKKRAASTSSSSGTTSESSSRSFMRRRRKGRSFSRRPRSPRSRRSASPARRRPQRSSWRRSMSPRRMSRSRGRGRSLRPSAMEVDGVAQRVTAFEERPMRPLSYQVVLLQRDMRDEVYSAMAPGVRAAFIFQGRSFARVAAGDVVIHGFKIYWVRKQLHHCWPESSRQLKIVVQKEDHAFAAVGVDPPPAWTTVARRGAPRRGAPRPAASQRATQAAMSGTASASGMPARKHASGRGGERAASASIVKVVLTPRGGGPPRPQTSRTTTAGPRTPDHSPPEAATPPWRSARPHRPLVRSRSRIRRVLNDLVHRSSLLGDRPGRAVPPGANSSPATTV